MNKFFLALVAVTLLSVSVIDARQNAQDAGMVLTVPPAQDTLSSGAASGVDAMHELLARYTAAIEDLTTEDKKAECDIIISNSPEGPLRADVVMWLFDHYMHSRVMGDESVAVAIYDKWIDGGVTPVGEDDLQSARIMVQFCRSSLVGADAPAIDLQGLDGRPVSLPMHCSSPDDYTVLYFYDTTCKSCKAMTILLRSVLSDFQALQIKLVAVYTGVDRDSWQEYARSQFDIQAENLSIIHAWDPECTSDYVRLYDVLGTPRLFLIDSKGIIQGRRLTVEALKRMLMAATVDAELHARVPEGSVIPDISVPATMVRSGRADSSGIFNLRQKRFCGRTYIMFHTPYCHRCEEQTEGLKASLRRRDRAIMVNLDDVSRTDEAILKELLDTFDLTVLPHIICTDRRGRVLSKYLDFNEKR